MSDRTKIFVAFASLLMLAVAVVMYSPAAYNAQPPKLAMTIRAVLLATGSIGLVLLLWNLFRPDSYPDFLRHEFGRPFECHGLCFVVFMVVHEGAAQVLLYFQNRYDGQCVATIRLVPSNDAMLPLVFECSSDGGEFGVIRRTIHVPLIVQGKEIDFSVLAKCAYPEGRGKLRRFRDGFPVDNLNQKQRDIRSVLFALIGQVHISKSAKIRLRMPLGVAEILTHDLPDQVSSLWSPRRDGLLF